MIQKLNSGLAKRLDLNAILIFPFVYVRDAEVSAETKFVINTYKNQFVDFSGIGAVLLIVLLFLLLGVGLHSWWLLLLLLLPCEERTSYTSFSWLKFWKD